MLQVENLAVDLKLVIVNLMLVTRSGIDGCKTDASSCKSGRKPDVGTSKSDIGDSGVCEPDVFSRIDTDELWVLK